MKKREKEKLTFITGSALKSLYRYILTHVMLRTTFELDTMSTEI